MGALSLRVNKRELDQELCNTPQDLTTYAQKLADAKANVETLENRLKLEQAQLSLKVQQSPADYGLKDKPTVGAIEAVVLCDPRVQETTGELASARHSVALVWAVVDGLKAKRDLIPHVVRLFLAGYFPAPTEADMEDAQDASQLVLETATKTETKTATKRSPKGRKPAKAKAYDDDTPDKFEDGDEGAGDGF